ncbi:MAG TPA: GntR family transcriptional regulator [Solirubrobacteraceae bacterium]|jgi:DNA-binding GntR family transcriptional regulator|nr:GntR family transcriptional regulator [Solirubrobacteraceae bacterium]
MFKSTAYGELAAQLREAIARGDYANGRQLPTEAELGDLHDVSRQTVRRALQELVSEGLVFRVRGRGTFATTLAPNTHYFRSIGSIDDLLALSLDTTRETIHPLSLRADVSAASRLQLDSDQVSSALFRRVHEGIAFGVTEVLLPPAVGRELLARKVLAKTGEIASRAIVGIVDEIVADGVAGAHQSITAVPLSEEHAGMLGSLAGAPALRIDRLYVDVQGRPVELAVSHFDPGRYTYRVQLRRGSSSRG